MPSSQIKSVTHKFVSKYTIATDHRLYDNLSFEPVSVNLLSLIMFAILFHYKIFSSLLIQYIKLIRVFILTCRWSLCQLSHVWSCSSILPHLCFYMVFHIQVQNHSNNTLGYRWLPLAALSGRPAAWRDVTLPLLPNTLTVFQFNFRAAEMLVFTDCDYC